MSSLYLRREDSASAAYCSRRGVVLWGLQVHVIGRGVRWQYESIFVRLFPRLVGIYKKETVQCCGGVHYDINILILSLFLFRFLISSIWWESIGSVLFLSYSLRGYIRKRAGLGLERELRD